MSEHPLNVVPKEMADEVLNYWDANSGLSYNKCARHFNIHPMAIAKFLKDSGRLSTKSPYNANKENLGRKEFRYMTDEEADRDLDEYLKTKMEGGKNEVT